MTSDQEKELRAHAEWLRERDPEVADAIDAVLAEREAHPFHEACPKCWAGLQATQKALQKTEAALREAQESLERVASLRARVLSMMDKRGWSTHWIHRSAYLHLEAAELAEAVRGKRGSTLDESADVLITMLALSPHSLNEIVDAAGAKVLNLEAKPRYAGEETSHAAAQPATPEGQDMMGRVTPNTKLLRG